MSILSLVVRHANVKATCLPPESLRFLNDLTKHNDKDWFAVNRDRSERELMVPARALVESICAAIAVPFPQLIGSAKSSGGSLTRLHRDVRFSKDKQPFHTHIGMHFWHRQGRKQEVPGFFLRIDPTEVLIGTGLHQPEPDVLLAVRRAIDRDRPGWTCAVHDKTFLRTWRGLDGEQLKRVPAPWPADHPLADDLRRKDFTAFVRLPAAAVTKTAFVGEAVTHWKASKPLMSFLCVAMKLAD